MYVSFSSYSLCFASMPFLLVSLLLNKVLILTYKIFLLWLLTFFFFKIFMLWQFHTYKIHFSHFQSPLIFCNYVYMGVCRRLYLWEQCWRLQVLRIKPRALGRAVHAPKCWAISTVQWKVIFSLVVSRFKFTFFSTLNFLAFGEENENKMFKEYG